jgi:hypothetical protein
LQQCVTSSAHRPCWVWAATLLALAQGDLDTPLRRLPKGPHNFDLFHSIRFEILVDGVEAFTA